MTIKIKPHAYYLVTGGRGFLGNPLIKRLLSMDANVVTISRTSYDYDIENSQIHIIQGDISDSTILSKIFKTYNIQGIFHLAAFKHIRLAEQKSIECIESNILGTLNILRYGSRFNVQFILGISTDKACQVSGVYGATKMLMERMFEEFERKNPNIQYRLLRLGNLIYSTGSVLCKWKQLLENDETIIITDPNITRFFQTITQAIDLMFECLKNSTSTKPYIPMMKSIRIGDLLQVMIKKYHPNKITTKIQQIGIQQGENLHEKIHIDMPASNEVDYYTFKEIYDMI